MATSPSIESRQLLLIANGVVHELQVETKSIVTADSFLRALTQSQSVSTPLLPDGCISLTTRQNGEADFWIIRPPTVWSVGFQQGTTPYSETPFGVLVPWQLYKVRAVTSIPCSIDMFFMKNRPLDLNAAVFRSYLLNQDDSGRCCVHRDLMTECGDRTVPLVSRLNKLVHKVSCSNFNDDLSGWRVAKPASVTDTSPNTAPNIAPNNTEGGVWCRRLAVWTTNKLATGESPYKLAEDIDMVPLATLGNLISNSTT